MNNGAHISDEEINELLEKLKQLPNKSFHDALVKVLATRPALQEMIKRYQRDTGDAFEQRCSPADIPVADAGTIGQANRSPTMKSL